MTCSNNIKLNYIVERLKMKFADAIKQSLKMLSSPEFEKRVMEEDATMMKHFDIIKEINKKGFYQ